MATGPCTDTSTDLFLAGQICLLSDTHERFNPHLYFTKGTYTQASHKCASTRCKSPNTRSCKTQPTGLQAMDAAYVFI